MSSHDCQLVGTLPLKAGTSEADLRAALHDFLNDHQLDFAQQVVEGNLAFDEGSITLGLKFFGYGGYQNDTVNALVAALSPLVDGHGHFEMFDYDTGNPDAACVPYFVAASDFEEKLAKLEYGIAQMKDYVQPLVGDNRFKHLESNIAEMMKQFMAEGGFEAPQATAQAPHPSTSGEGFNRARAQLEALKAGGLTFADCTRAFAVPNDDPYVVAARDMILGDDDTEIDDETVTSVGDDGAWVLSWLWVSNSDAGVPDEGEDEDEG